MNRREIKIFWSSDDSCYLQRANHWCSKGHSSKTFSENDRFSPVAWLDKKDREVND